MKKSLFIFAALCLLALPALAESRAGVSAVMTSTTASTAEKKISVLFLGNSYTYSNDMPKMLADIASNDPGNHVQLEIQSATKQGGTLETLWQDNRIREAFAERRWSYVVLQEQSLWAALPESVEETTTSARKWAELATAVEATPVIFASWARQPNSFWYTDRKYSFLGSPRRMQENLDKNAAALAASLRGIVAPVGAAWAAALKDDVTWPLYGPDSHQPTPAGSYLSALVFYQLFTGRSAEDTTFVPAGVSAEAAARLRKFAAAVRGK